MGMGDWQHLGSTALRGIVATLVICAAFAGRPNVATAGLFCPDDCSGRGACRFEGVFNPERRGWPWSRVCVCDPGWTGDDCSLCASSDVCPGRQVCRFGECRCRTGWHGENCDLCHSSVACGEHGSCYEEACVCEPGWTGIDCRTPANRAADDGENGDQPKVPEDDGRR